MTEHGTQYDHIGSKNDEYARTATLKRAERYAFFRLVEPLAGKRVLDLACGVGFYTRLCKQRGATRVMGVDISPEMIRLARHQEQAEPLGWRVTCIRLSARRSTSAIAFIEQEGYRHGRMVSKLHCPAVGVRAA